MLIMVIDVKFMIAGLFFFSVIQSVLADEPNVIVRGVNYDPVHSLEFAKAVGLDDRQVRVGL